MPVLKDAIQVEGALVDGVVGWSAANIQDQRIALRPVPPAVAIRALLDSGAEMTSLDVSVVRVLGLPIRAIIPVNAPAAGGLAFTTQYEVDLTTSHPSGDPHASLVLRNWLVVELPIGVLGYQALIGRDVLARCRFLYHGPRGRFWLAY